MAEEVNLKVILDPNLPENEAASQIADYCSVNTQDMETALSRQGALYSYAVASHEIAKVDEAKAKWGMEQAKAMAYQIFIDQDAKATVALMDKKVATAPSVRTAQERLEKTMVVSARLKALVLGLEHRKDMLVQIAAKQRVEMAG